MRTERYIQKLRPTVAAIKGNANAIEPERKLCLDRKRVPPRIERLLHNFDTTHLRDIRFIIVIRVIEAVRVATAIVVIGQDIFRVAVIDSVITLCGRLRMGHLYGEPRE